MLKALETLNISGKDNSSQLCSAIRSENLNNQKGGNIYISAENLKIESGGRIRTFSFNEEKGGDIKLDILSLSYLHKGSIIATTLGTGNAGNINLSTQKLQINFAGICSSTFAKGNGGIITINSDSIEVSGNKAGERGSIAATSFAFGNAGTLTINASQVHVSEGASLSSSSFASGDAGTLTINASKLVEIIGENNNTSIGINPQTTIRAAVQSVSSRGQKAYGLPATPSGNSGHLFIKTPFLSVFQGGIITVENQGTGEAGKVEIDADILKIDGKITATTISDNGKIIINTSKLTV